MSEAAVGLFILTGDPRRRAAGKDAAIAGYIADLAQAMALSQVVVVLLGCAVAGEEPDADIGGVACRIVRLASPTRAEALAHAARRIVCGEPVVLGQALFLSQAVVARVRALIRQTRASVVMFDTIRCFTAALVCGRAMMLYDDLFSRRYAARDAGEVGAVFGRYSAQVGELAPMWAAKRLAGVLRRCEAWLCGRKERHVARRLPGFILNVAEAEVLRAIPGAKPVAAYVPSVVEGLWPDRRPGASRFWLFVGAFAHAPNRRAMTWLARDVMPRYRALGGQAEVWIVGAGDAPPLGDAAMRVLGRVEDLRPLYDTCVGVLAPAAIGSGIRVKLLEAMAFACPVVATPLCCAGFDRWPDGVAMAETAAAFAEAMRGYEAAGPAANLAARGWYERQFGPERIERLQAMLA